MTRQEETQHRIVSCAIFGLLTACCIYFAFSVRLWSLPFWLLSIAGTLTGFVTLVAIIAPGDGLTDDQLQRYAPRKSCWNCSHWNRIEGASQGECCASAPSAVPQIVGHAWSTGRVRNAKTDWDFGCGEFEEKS